LSSSFDGCSAFTEIGDSVTVEWTSIDPESIEWRLLSGSGKLLGVPSSSSPEPVKDSPPRRWIADEFL